MLIRKLLEWLFGPFPQQKRGYWYCGAWYLYLGDLSEKGHRFASLNPDWKDLPPSPEGKFCFNPFRCGLAAGCVDDCVDGLIPAIRIGDRIGLYRISSINASSRFYDGASWDDGNKVCLTFVRSVPIDQTCQRDAKE